MPVNKETKIGLAVLGVGTLVAGIGIFSKLNKGGQVDAAVADGVQRAFNSPTAVTSEASDYSQGQPRLVATPDLSELNRRLVEKMRDLRRSTSTPIRSGSTPTLVSGDDEEGDGLLSHFSLKKLNEKKIDLSKPPTYVGYGIEACLSQGSVVQGFPDNLLSLLAGKAEASQDPEQEKINTINCIKGIDKETNLYADRGIPVDKLTVDNVLDKKTIVQYRTELPQMLKEKGITLTPEQFNALLGDTVISTFRIPGTNTIGTYTEIFSDNQAFVEAQRAAGDKRYQWTGILARVFIIEGKVYLVDINCTNLKITPSKPVEKPTPPASPTKEVKASPTSEKKKEATPTTPPRKPVELITPSPAPTNVHILPTPTRGREITPTPKPTVLPPTPSPAPTNVHELPTPTRGPDVSPTPKPTVLPPKPTAAPTNVDALPTPTRGPDTQPSPTTPPKPAAPTAVPTSKPEAPTAAPTAAPKPTVLPTKPTSIPV